MYICDRSEEETRRHFRQYAEMHADLTFKHAGVLHWAKVDLNFHNGPERLAALINRYSARFDVAGFRTLAKELDPHRILSSGLVDTCLLD